MRAIHLQRRAPALAMLALAATAALLLAGSAAAVGPDPVGSAQQAAALADDAVHSAPGFADAAEQLALGAAQPYEDQAFAQVDAASAVATAVGAQANGLVCSSCHLEDAKDFLPALLAGAHGLADVGDAPTQDALGHAFAAVEQAKQGGAPEAGWLCPSAQQDAAGALAGAAGSGGVLADAGFAFAGSEAALLPAGSGTAGDALGAAQALAPPALPALPAPGAPC